jgi:hypothetical protein
VSENFSRYAASKAGERAARPRRRGRRKGRRASRRRGQALAEKATVREPLKRRLELKPCRPAALLRRASGTPPRARRISAIQPDPDRRDAVDAGRRYEQTERGGDAGHDGQIRAQAQLARDVAGVDRPGASGTEQRMVARIAPALGDVHAGGARHASLTMSGCPATEISGRRIVREPRRLGSRDDVDRDAAGK